uniref:Uncharacterized protein n=1 Tax=Anguilla anguilla TaxID=7936 RepID=A0A0E9WWG0_ANGAN
MNYTCVRFTLSKHFTLWSGASTSTTIWAYTSS